MVRIIQFSADKLGFSWGLCCVVEALVVAVVPAAAPVATGELVYCIFPSTLPAELIHISRMASFPFCLYRSSVLWSHGDGPHIAPRC